MKTYENWLWEILVPKNKPLKLHKAWDKKVESIAGGLTILKPVKGSWVSANNTTIKEPMIPVRIMCNYEEILAIADMTRLHYGEEAVMYYLISKEIKIHQKNIGIWKIYKERIDRES